MLVPSQRIAGPRFNDSRGLRPAPRKQRALRDSALWRLIGGRIGKTRHDALAMSSDAGQLFTQLRMHVRKVTSYAEHQPIQAADRGENRQQEAAVESSAVHAEKPITAKKISSTGSFWAKHAVIVVPVALHAHVSITLPRH